MKSEGPRYRTEDQAKFMAMIHELEKRFGLNKSAIAKRAGFSPATISAVDDGTRNPRSALMELQRFYETLIKPTGEIQPMREILSPDGVHEKLQDLKAKDPSAYNQAKSNIEFLHDRATRPETNRTPPAEPSKLDVDEVAERLAMREIAKYPSKKKKS